LPRGRGTTAAVGTTEPEALRDRTQTRARILAAALDLFVERGYEGTTVTAIEREVGLAAGSGSLYRHFRSKEDVFVACIEHYSAEYLQRFLPELEAVRKIEDPRERLVRDFQLRLSGFRAFGPIARLMAAEHARFPGLDKALTAPLELDAWNLDWDDSPLPAIAMAAVIGYATLSATPGGPYTSISEDEFVTAVADLLIDAGVALPERRPPRSTQRPNRRHSSRG
jgi:AcrR family transcriptional regulator